MNINGTNDNNMINVYSNTSVTCRIHCQSQYACTKLYFYCFGDCYTNCDASNNNTDYDCPLIINYMLNPNDNNNKNDNSDSNYNDIIFIIIGCAISLLLILFIVYKYYLQHYRPNQEISKQNEKNSSIIY